MNHDAAIGSILLREVDQLAREKYLEKHAVFSALEDAIKTVSLASYGYNNDIRVRINRDSGEINITRHRKIVDEVMNPHKEISRTDPIIGDATSDLIEKIPMQVGRAELYSIKNQLSKRIYELERIRQYHEYKDRVGEVVIGVVKRMEFQHVFVDIGRAEGVIFRNEMIAREKYRIGDSIKSYIHEVESKPRGAQIFLSRTHPNFIRRLFEQEVVEVSDGSIELKAIARDPGSRAKVAIFSRDSSIDPIGACVGVKGSRVNAVSKEINGEKIDVILWSSDLATFVVNALTPAEVTRVVVDSQRNRVTVVVPDNQQSIAIGRRGQNVMLAHQLTGCHIDIVSETDDIASRTATRNDRVAYFMGHLDIEEMMAYLLISEGFESLQDIVETSVTELASLQGFNDEIAEELSTRAAEAFEKETVCKKQELLDKGFDEKLFDIGLSMDALFFLSKNNINKTSELGDLSIDDVSDIAKKCSFYIDEALWKGVIMRAREIV